MNMFHKFFGRDIASQRSKRTTKKASRANLSVEPLEERHMLAITSLIGGAIAASVDSGETAEVSMRVQTEADKANAALGIVIESTSQFDPAAIKIVGSDGKEISAKSYLFSENDGTKSTVVVNLPEGDYKIQVQGDRGTYGAFTCDVFMPGVLQPEEGGGDGSGAGVVSTLDQLKAQTAVSQGSGNWNENTIRYYQTIGRQLGYSKAQYDPVVNMYSPAYDLDSDGIVTAGEASMIATNAQAGEVEVTLNASAAITITAKVKHPVTSDADTTRELVLEGTVSGSVGEFTAVFTSAPSGVEIEKTTATNILSKLSGGKFELDAETLVEIFGSDEETLPDGTYKIKFSATGTGENPSTTTFEYEFTLYTRQSRPETVDLDAGTLYPVDGDSHIEIDIEDLVEDDDAIDSHALVSVKDANGTTHTIVHDEVVEIKDAEGVVVGTLVYTGGTKGIGDTYYGGKIVIKPTAAQIALSKGADEISNALEFIVQDDSGTQTDQSDEDRPGTLSWKVTPVNKTPVVDLEDVPTRHVAGDEAFEIDLADIASDANADDELVFGTVTVKVGNTTISGSTADGVTTWTTPQGTVITFDSDAQIIRIQPADEDAETENISLAFTVKDDAGVTSDNTTTGEQKSETAVQTLELTVSSAGTAPSVTVRDMTLTATEAEAGNIATGWTVSYGGEGTLVYKIGKTGGTLTTIPADGTATEVPGLGTFTLSAAGVLTWTVVDESLYENITDTQTLSVSYSASAGEETTLKTATVSITAVSQNEFEDQDIYISPNLTADSEGRVSSTGALVANMPEGTTVTYAIESVSDPEGTEFDKTKFSIDEDGKIVVSAEDLDEFEIGTYVIVVKATFTTGDATEEITANVSLNVEEGIPSLVDATVNIAEKETDAESATGAVSGLGEHETWHLVEDSLVLDAEVAVSAHGNVEAGTVTLDAEDLSAILALASVSRDTETGDLVFTFTPDAAYREYFRFLSEGQQATLKFTCRIEGDRYGQTAEGEYTLIVTGQNDQPVLQDITGASDADTPITVTIESLLEQGKIDDHDQADQFSFYRIAGTEIDAAFLEGARTITLSSGAVITVAVDGKSFTYSSGSAGTSDFYALREGVTQTDTFAFSIKDDSGVITNAASEEKNATFTITGTNKAPTAVANPETLETTEGEHVTVAVGTEGAYATDPNTGDTMIFHAVTADRVVSINGTALAEIGQGTVTRDDDADQVMLLESGATITLKTDGTIVYTPGRVANATTFTEEFTYTVIDDAPTTPSVSENSGTLRIAVAGIPHAPELLDPGNDTTSVTIDETQHATVIAPDELGDLWIDFDGDALTPVLQGTASFAIFDEDGQADAELQNFLAELLASGKAGRFTVAADGSVSFVFSQDAYKQLGIGQYVTATISYKMREVGEGGVTSEDTGTLAVRIDGINDPPQRLRDPLALGVIASDTGTVSISVDAILSESNWSDPDFNDRPMSDHYDVSINVIDFNGMQLGSLEYDETQKRWTYVPDGAFDYLKENEIRHVFIEYVITSLRNENHSAAGWLLVDVEGVFFPVSADDQEFTYSTESAAGETYVGTVAFTQHLAERYGFGIASDSVKAYDADGVELALTEAAQWRVDANGNIYVTTSDQTDWTDVAYYEFALTIANTDSERDDSVTIAVRVDIVAEGTALVVGGTTLTGSEGGDALTTDLKEKIEGEFGDVSFDSLKLVSTNLDQAGEIAESLFSKLSGLGFVALDADGNFTLTPDEVTFAFVPGGDTFEMVFQYVVTDVTTGLKSLANITVYVTGVNNVPKTYDYEHPTAVDADDAAGISVSIDDLMDAQKVVDPDFQDVVTFDTIAATTIDAAFLAGDREIVLPSGSRIVVAETADSFVYFPNASETDNPFYTLRHGAIVKDVFSYSVVDAAGAKSHDGEGTLLPNLTMQIRGVNKTPTQKDIADVPAELKTVSETGSVTFGAGDLARDVNVGDTLQFGSVSFGGVALVQGGEGVKNAHGSTLTWNADGTLTLDAQTRDGNVALGEIGDDDVVTFTVVDDSGADNAESASWTHTVKVTGLNDAPLGNDYAMTDAEAVQVGQAGTQTTINVSFDRLFADPDRYPTPDSHEVYVQSGTEYLLVTAQGVTISSLACTVKPGADGRSLDFVFDVSEGNLYDALSEGQIASALLNFYVVDQHGAASGSDAEGDHGTINLKLKGLNKRPVVRDAATAQTVEVDETLTIRASDLVTDRNTNDAHTFVQINGEALPSVGSEITLYDQDDPTLEIGTLKVVSASELLFTPNPDLAGENGLGEGESVAGSFTFLVADDSGADDAQAAEATMDLTVVPASIQSREFVGSLLSTGSTVLDLNDYFSGSNLTFKLAGIDYGYEFSDPENSPPAFEGFLREGNIEAIEALVNQEIVGGTIDLDFIGIGDYKQSLDFSPITLNLLVYDEAGNLLDDQSGDFMIRLEEQYTTVVYMEPSKEARTPSIDENRPNSFVDYLPGDTEIWTADNPFQVEVGERYYIRYWVQDLANLYFGEGTSSGLVESLFYVPFDGTISSVETMIASGLYNMTQFDPDTRNTTDASMEWMGSNSPDFLLGLALYDKALVTIQLDVYASGAGAPGFHIDASRFLGTSVLRYDDIGDTYHTLHNSQIKFIDAYIEHVPQGSDSALTALSRPEVEEDGGIYMRTVESPTQTGHGGIVSELPEEANMLHEWQTHYVELWVKASEADKYTFATTDLTYNSEYFTATEVQLGDTFRIGEGATINDAEGLVSGIGGYAQKFEERDGYILLGRVKFESVGDDNVAWGDNLTAHSLGLELENGGVRSVSGEWISKLGSGSDTELWANPYDVNDDQAITIVDFSQFVKVYGQRGSDGMPLMSGFDFDNNGVVTITDFSYFAKGYGVRREVVRSGAKEIVLPESYTQRYVGMRLDADNLDNVGTLLDAANRAWADALGRETPLEIRLAVKDYGDGTTLGEAMLLEVDENGIPTRGLITLDNDAAGLGWYSRITDPVNESNYDLYTTLLHELGHIYGINTAYNAFQSVKFQYGGLIDSTGHVTIEDDVMYAGINTGQRKFISELDVNIIMTAYGAAYGNNMLHGFSNTPARLEAYGEKTDTQIAAEITEVVEIVQNGRAASQEFGTSDEAMRDETTTPGDADVFAVFEDAEVFQSDVRLDVPVARESATPAILDNRANARSLAELNTLGLDIALPRVQASGSAIESVDFIVGELFPTDGLDEKDDEYDWLETERQNADDFDLVGRLLDELL